MQRVLTFQELLSSCTQRVTIEFLKQANAPLKSAILTLVPEFMGFSVVQKAEFAQVLFRLGGPAAVKVPGLFSNLGK
jgi:hypothetical protein